MASPQADTTFVKVRLDSLRSSHLLRRLRKVEVLGPADIIVDGRKAIHLCSNDYLGLSTHRKVVAASIPRGPISPCSSRLVAGNTPAFSQLESALADHRQTQSALVFPTGYAACLGAISAIADKKTIIYSDELNHSSIIDACRLSAAAIRIFPHNDAEALERLMSEQKSDGRKVVVTEGIFSMDGDISPLARIAKIAHEHRALVAVDDAHGDFVLGPHGRGTAARSKALVDIHIGSLSKALGCFGGYVAASTEIIEFFVNTSRQFIYTSALPDHLCRAAIAALGIADTGLLQRRLLSNAKRLKKNLEEEGFQLGSSPTQILPVIMGDEERALEFSSELLNQGVFAPAIRYPTVRRGAARVRVSVTALHDQKMCTRIVDAFRTAGKKTSLF
ncbi:MAG: 8-amino-7-oxononanoate synthase [Nitrososphaera sp.]